jgi:undecaprenyl-diphosphatase
MVDTTTADDAAAEHPGAAGDRGPEGGGHHGVLGALRARWRHWRAGSFGPASELPYRRRTSDWVRLIVAVVIMALLIRHESDVTSTEKNLFEFFNTLPDGLRSFFSFLYRFGALWAAAIIVLAALLARRWRLARDLAISGVLAWFVGRFLGELVVAGTSFAKGLHVVTRFRNDTPEFPVVRLAIIVAVIAAASPYLTRPVRRVGQFLILLLALAAMYLGTGLPNEIFAGIVLGWGLAAAVHLAFGSPGGRPTRVQVAAALAELGVDARDVELDGKHDERGTWMTARDDDGPLELRVLGRDEADAQYLAKAWRYIAYKDGGPTVHLTRLEDVEHEAYTVLLAERAGARVPPVVVAGKAGPSTAVLASRPLEGNPLCEVDQAQVTDELLDDLWRQVTCLHAARVAHGKLHAGHVLVTVDGAAIGDFVDASTTASDERRSADVAELLYSTSTIVGQDRAVAAALRGVGAEGVLASLPFLQPVALGREVRPRGRHEQRQFKEHIGNLRDAAAAAAGAEVPPLQQLYRVSGTNLLMAIGTLIAVFALLSQVGSPQQFYDTIKDADWVWLAVALVVSLLTNFATAIALMGTVPNPLPLVRTAELQLSMSFSNLAVPAVGGMAAQIRFLQKQGTDLASAVASGGLLMNAGNIFINLVLFGIAILLSPSDIHTGNVPTSEIVKVVVLIVLVAIVVVGLVLGVPKLRKLVMPPVKSATATMWEALRSPRRVALLLGGNAINALMYAGVYMACIAAFGGSVNFWTLLALNILIGTIASLVPIPGGGTAVSSVGMSGALAAVGVPTAIAVAAVLANQLVTSFIPAVPGWWATNDLLEDGYL